MSCENQGKGMTLHWRNHSARGQFVATRVIDGNTGIERVIIPQQTSIANAGREAPEIFNFEIQAGQKNDDEAGENKTDFNPPEAGYAQAAD